MTVYEHEVVPYPGVWHRENGRDRLRERRSGFSRPTYMRLFESERLMRSYRRRPTPKESKG